MKAQFIKSAVQLWECPQDRIKEVVFLGRSNAGKSSLINALLKKKSLAKVSGTPGKTRLLNFFLVNDKYRFVDLPGYGYAARSGEERQVWGETIENFLTHRQNIVGFVLIMDIRRKWSVDEQSIFDLANKLGLSGCLVLTKKDKLNKKELSLAKKRFELDAPGWDQYAVSNTKGDGVEELHLKMFTKWDLAKKCDWILDA